LGVLVPPANVKELSKWILRALERVWDRKKLCERAGQFNWDDAANMKSDLYKRLVEV
jgi:glycosyltransferase involved in cell wall biosynthesis